MSFDRLQPLWSLAEVGEPLSLTDVFGADVKLCVEIGSGNGGLASSFARTHPTIGLVSIDVHRPGIARMLDDIEEWSLTNLRVVEGDALLFLKRLADRSIDELWVFFPDPWPKNSQSHRRLVTDERIGELARVIKPGGALRLATDVVAYAEQMRKVAVSSGLFTDVYGDRPGWRVETAFESAGLAAGRQTIDLCCVRGQ
jgi:tRNA (guanine-N7-)-methyltransferase